MLFNIAIASIIMLLTTVIHAGGMMLVMRSIRNKKGHWQHSDTYWVSAAVMLMFIVTLLEVWVWAAAYLALDAIQHIEPAFYFSMVTFTTLGYGDIVLDEHWRLLASFEAANGIVMFGWTTASVIAVVQRIYFSKES